MGKNKYYKIKKNKYIWKDDRMKIVFSNPSIQSFDYYKFVENANEILYFYYDVKIYKSVSIYNNSGEVKKEVWKKITQRRVYDFPCIVQFLYMLDDILHKDIELEKCQKDVYVQSSTKGYIPSGKVGYTYTESTEGFACEDFYKLSKTLVMDECEYEDETQRNKPYEKFSLYAGCTTSCQGDNCSVGMNNPYVTRKSLEQLYRCVNDFVQYAIDKHNEAFKNNIYKSINSNKIIDNKLYIFDEQKIESIYVVGDFVEVKVLQGDLNTNKYSVDEYKGVISAINESSIDLEMHDKQTMTININVIKSVFEDMQDFKLKYNEKEVYKDFTSIMTNYDIKEFANNNVEYLYDKYNEAISSRTWMYRDEHNFKKYIDSSEHDNVDYIIRKMIKKIKKNKS